MDNVWEEHEHGRPSPRAGKDGHSYASRKHEDEEALRRFAKALARWLVTKMAELRVERLNLFAPARLLAAMNGSCDPAMAGRIDEHASDLCYMTTAELVQHPAVQQVMIDRK